VLPQDVDTTKIAAGLDAGVLTVTLPRVTQAAPERKKSIEIK
jgi:HSP20 family molecular chaperone IbpA